MSTCHVESQLPSRESNLHPPRWTQGSPRTQMSVEQEDCLSDRWPRRHRLGQRGAVWEARRHDADSLRCINEIKCVRHAQTKSGLEQAGQLNHSTRVLPAVSRSPSQAT